LKDHNPHGGGNEYELEQALGVDMLLTSVGWANSYYQDLDEYTDEWGIGWRSQRYETRYGTGRYTEICHHPLAEDLAIDRYLPPDPDRPELYTEAQRVICSYKNEYWIVGVTVTTIFETAWALRGLQRLLMDLIVNPKLADHPRSDRNRLGCAESYPTGLHEPLRSQGTIRRQPLLLGHDR